MTDLRTLPDKLLAYLLEELERHVAALKFSTTVTGSRLLEQYQENLDAAHAEQERRRC